MTTKTEHKAVISIGYVHFVLDAKAATELFLVLTGGNVERYDDKWNSSTKLSEPRVMPVERDAIKITILDHARYALGKLLYTQEQLNPKDES